MIYRLLIVTILAILISALLGCSTNEMRVTEYGAGVFSAEIGGCTVQTTDNPPAGVITLEYMGENCNLTYEVAQ